MAKASGPEILTIAIPAAPAAVAIAAMVSVSFIMTDRGYDEGENTDKGKVQENRPPALEHLAKLGGTE